VGDTGAMKVLQAADKLLEEEPGIVLWEPLVLADEAKQLST
jgi:hypothetical protein